MFECCCVKGDEGVVEDPIKGDLTTQEAVIHDRQGFTDVKVLTHPNGFVELPGFEEPNVGPAVDDAGGFLFRLHRVHMEEPFGAVLDMMQGLGEIHICALLPRASAVSRANMGAAQDRQMQVGDYITHVNGICGDTSQMIEELASKLRLDLRLSRPLLFPVQVNKAEGTMGCRISYDADNGSSLVVETITEGGLISRWNSVAEPQIMEGDRIVAVDGKTGKAIELLDRIQAASGELQLRMSRPSRTLDA